MVRSERSANQSRQTVTTTTRTKFPEEEDERERERDARVLHKRLKSLKQGNISYARKHTLTRQNEALKQKSTLKEETKEERTRTEESCGSLKRNLLA